MRTRPDIRQAPLVLPFMRTSPTILPPPRRFLSRNRRPGFLVLFLAALSATGCLASFLLLLGGQLPQALAAFATTTLALLGMLLLAP